jgi:hypothetical protein
MRDAALANVGVSAVAKSMRVSERKQRRLPAFVLGRPQTFCEALRRLAPLGEKESDPYEYLSSCGGVRTSQGR